MGAPTILVVEDDESIGRALSGALRSQGYSVEWKATGEEALTEIGGSTPDLMIVDLGLPDLDGTEVCRRARAHDAALPIIVLTARQSEVDIVVGLDAGADDYVTKPFRLAELLARVRAHLRRTRGSESTAQLEVGDVRVDPDSRRAWVGDQELHLRTKEFNLLALLVSEAGAALTRERIMSEVWDEHWFGPTKTLDVHISTLRRRLADATTTGALPPQITTLRGVGYRFERP